MPANRSTKVGPLKQSELDEAERVFRLAFGTFLGMPNPLDFMGDRNLSTMRRILINQANARNAGKRAAFSGAISLEGDLGPAIDPDTDLLAVDQLLDRLTLLDPQQGKVVELRYFGGLSIEETAEVMGISEVTVKRDWRTARLWFIRQMKNSQPAS